MAVTRQGLLDFFSSSFGLSPDELGDDAPIFSQGLLDSFHLVELVGHLEAEGGIKIGAMDLNLENLDTIGGILRYCESKGAC